MLSWTESVDVISGTAGWRTHHTLIYEDDTVLERVKGKTSTSAEITSFEINLRLIQLRWRNECLIQAKQRDLALRRRMRDFSSLFNRALLWESRTLDLGGLACGLEAIVPGLVTRGNVRAFHDEHCWEFALKLGQSKHESHDKGAIPNLLQRRGSYVVRCGLELHMVGSAFRLIDAIPGGMKLFASKSTSPPAVKLERESLCYIVLKAESGF